MKISAIYLPLKSAIKEVISEKFSEIADNKTEINYHT